MTAAQKAYYFSTAYLLNSSISVQPFPTQVKVLSPGTNILESLITLSISRFQRYEVILSTQQIPRKFILCPTSHRDKFHCTILNWFF